MLLRKMEKTTVEKNIQSERATRTVNFENLTEENSNLLTFPNLSHTAYEGMRLLLLLLTGTYYFVTCSVEGVDLIQCP